MNKKLIIDLDGVVADFVGGVAKRHEEMFGEAINPFAINNYEMGDAMQDGRFEKIMASDGFFDSLEPMPNVVLYLRLLIELGYEILFVTVLPRVRGSSLEDKERWTQRHIFNKTNLRKEENLVISFGSKKWANGYAMIEDKPEHLKHFNGRRYLVDWPYNRDCDDDKHNIIRLQKETAWRDFTVDLILNEK